MKVLWLIVSSRDGENITVVMMKMLVLGVVSINTLLIANNLPCTYLPSSVELVALNNDIVVYFIRPESS